MGWEDVSFEPSEGASPRGSTRTTTVESDYYSSDYSSESCGSYGYGDHDDGGDYDDAEDSGKAHTAMIRAMVGRRVRVFVR